jgi:hypothetical protein
LDLQLMQESSSGIICLWLCLWRHLPMWVKDWCQCYVILSLHKVNVLVLYLSTYSTSRSLKVPQRQQTIRCWIYFHWHEFDLWRRSDSPTEYQ